MAEKFLMRKILAGIAMIVQNETSMPCEKFPFSMSSSRFRPMRNVRCCSGEIHDKNSKYIFVYFVSFAKIRDSILPHRTRASGAAVFV